MSGSFRWEKINQPPYREGAVLTLATWQDLRMFPSPTGADKPEQRVIRVDQAIRCCELQVDRALAVMTDIAISLQQDESDSALAFAPMVVPTKAPAGPIRPEVIRIPKGQSLAPGAILIFGGLLLNEISNAFGVAAYAQTVLDMESAIRRVVQRSTPTRPGACEECMMKRALRQEPNERDNITTKTGQVIQKRR